MRHILIGMLFFLIEDLLPSLKTNLI